MSDVSVSFDMSELRKAVEQLSRNSKRRFCQLSNQALYDVVGNAFKAIKPGEGQSAVDQERANIRAYLRQRIGADAYRITKTGKKSKKRKKKSLQLMRRMLIIQAIYKRKGYKGLYGERMKKAQGAFALSKSRGAGCLQAPLSFIISAMGRFVQYRLPFASYKNRIIGNTKEGPGGSIDYKVDPAKPGENNEAGVMWEMEIHTSPLAKSDQLAHVEDIYQRAVQGAMDDKMRHFENQIARELQKEMDDITA